ncbi:MAG: 6-phospho-beta-glucosidase [Anaerolineae bacterium]|nr:6-phospho-beta-glucosidase [Anaerolineae bacterium]
MKVAVIGGGSTYTPELINGFLDRTASFPLTELWLMDIAPEQLGIVGGFAQRMVAARGNPFQVHLTTDQREAVQGARYVITQLRVGMMQARREDEYLGKRHGLIGQETTGIGGMSKALRTIPVILDIANDVRDLAPDALLVSFTNPAGLIAQAVSQQVPDVPVVGVCNGPFHTKMQIVANLNQYRDLAIDPDQAQLDALGLNHLSWFRGLTANGQDVWPEVIGLYVNEAPDPRWDARTIEALGMIPNGYFEYYYYTSRKLALQDQWPPSRAEEVMAIEKELLAQYAEPDRTEPPAGLMQRGGAFYSTVATQLLNAHYNDLGETHVVNVRHNGAVPGWPADWVLEMPCRVDAAGVHPLPAEPLPSVCYGLLAAVKAYELLTVEAAIKGDRRAAYQALLVHPLGPQADQIQTVLDDMLTTHKAHLPLFWPEG